MIGLLLGLISLAATVVVLWDAHHVAIQHARERVGGVGAAVSTQVLHRLRAIDLLFGHLQAATQRRHVQTGAQFSRLMRDGAWDASLLADMVRLGDISALTLVDISGRAIVSTDPQVRPGAPFGQRRDYAQPAAVPPAGFSIGGPRVDPASGERLDFAVRPLRGSGGATVGFAVATFDLQAQIEAVARLPQGRHLAISLVRRDGVVLAHLPHAAAAGGADALNAKARNLQAHGWHGSMAASAPSCIAASRAVPGFPVVVNVTLPEQPALAAWRRQAVLTIVSELAVVSMFLVLFRMIVRQLREQLQQNEQLRAAMEAVRGSERRLRAYTEIASDWLWERDADLRLVWYSAAAPAYVVDDPGYRDMAAASQAAAHRADDIWRAHRDALLAGRPFRDLRCRAAEPDGTEHYLSFHAGPILDDSGAFCGFRGVARDVTTQVEAEHELCDAKERSERAEALLRDAVDRLDRAQQVAGIGSWEVDVLGERWYWSKQMFALLGLAQPAPNVCGDALIEAVHPEDRPTLERWLHDLRGGCRRDLIEVHVVRPDETVRTMQVDARIVTGPDGAVSRLSGTVQDVTERRAIEYRLFQAHNREMIGTLTGGIAHDFNNVLGLIVGNLELLERAVQSDPETGELATDALAAAYRCRDLIRRLLALARGEALRPKEVDVNRLLQAFADQLLHQLIGDTIEPTFDLEDALWPVMVDATRLESALTNLAANARDAMPRGGLLRLKTRNVGAESAGSPAQPKLPPGEYVMIAVADTGSGMPPEILEQIFDPFYSTKATGHGTGLGLAMVRGFVNQAGGHIIVDSVVGRGTEFRIYLPSSQRAQRDTPAGTGSPAAVGLSRTVLLADGCGPNRHAAAAQLRAQRLTVLEAATAEEALAALRSRRGVDLLLIGAEIPGPMSAAELSRRAMVCSPGIRVLLTAAEAGRGEEALRNPDDAQVLVPPVSPQELARVVQATLAKID